MLLKYIVSGTPTTEADALSDISRILAGELNIATLSANCDTALTIFMPDEIKPTEYFVIEATDATGAILRRTHTQFVGKTLWMDLRVFSNGNIRFGGLGDGTAGVRTNLDSNITSSSVGFSGASTITGGILGAGNEIYIGLTDTVAFLTTANGSGTCFWAELQELEATGVFSYADADPTVAWCMSGQQTSWWSTPTCLDMAGTAVGTIVGPQSTTNTLSVGKELDSGSSANFDSATDYPQLLSDGTLGLRLEALHCGFNGMPDQMSPFKVGGIYWADVYNVSSLVGMSFDVSVTERVLCLSCYTVPAALTTSAVSTVYISGV